MFNLDGDEVGEKDAKLDRVTEVIQEVVSNWKGANKDEEDDIMLAFDTLGHFGHRVVFAQPSIRENSSREGRFQVCSISKI